MARLEKTHPLFFWRKENGDRSLQSLAAEVKCTQSFLSQIELYEKQPSLAVAARLRRATGLPIEAFVREPEVSQ